MWFLVMVLVLAAIGLTIFLVEITQPSTEIRLTEKPEYIHAPHCFKYEGDPMGGPCMCGAEPFNPSLSNIGTKHYTSAPGDEPYEYPSEP
jgi:hypothetical protein